MSVNDLGWELKKAAEIIEFSTKSDENSDWSFENAIDNAIAIIESEQKAQREREAAERARIEKARHKAMIFRDRFIMPLLKYLCEDFAVDEEKVLPEWQIQTHEDAGTFTVAAVTPTLDPAGTTCFTIQAEASVADEGECVNLSVMCSSVNPESEAASQLLPLFLKTEKYPIVQKVDDMTSRMWLHEQLAECARLCVLTKMRQFPSGTKNAALLVSKN